MKIVFKDVDTVDLEQTVVDVVSSVFSKIGAKHEDFEDVKVDCEVLLSFKPVGQEEYSYICTDREIMGQYEVLTVVPELTEDGRLVGMEDNTERTFQQVAADLDKPLPTERIESKFPEVAEMEGTVLVSKEDAGELTETVYELEDGRMIIQYHREDVGLVHEIELQPKSDEDTEEVDS